MTSVGSRKILHRQAIVIDRGAHGRIAKQRQPRERDDWTLILHVIVAVLQQKAHVVPGLAGERNVAVQRANDAVERRTRQRKTEEARLTGEYSSKIRGNHRRIQCVWQERHVLRSSSPRELAAQLSITREIHAGVYAEALVIVIGRLS